MSSSFSTGRGAKGGGISPVPGKGIAEASRGLLPETSSDRLRRAATERTPSDDIAALADEAVASRCGAIARDVHALPRLDSVFVPRRLRLQKRILA